MDGGAQRFPRRADGGFTARRARLRVLGNEPLNKAMKVYTLEHEGE